MKRKNRGQADEKGAFERKNKRNERKGGMCVVCESLLGERDI
jgi:hypothetical protein